MLHTGTRNRAVTLRYRHLGFVRQEFAVLKGEAPFHAIRGRDRAETVRGAMEEDGQESAHRSVE
eukprot:scaffold48229_cov70-Phaeocystis_antarctica.AAC.4